MKPSLLVKLFLFILCFSPPLLASAQLTYVIDNGAVAPATYQAGPMYRSTASSAYYTSQYAYLYTAAELTAKGMAPGKITKIAWYCENTATLGTTRTNKFQIYLKNSSASSFSAASVTWAAITTGASNVYSTSNLTLPGAVGWVEFTLDNGFVWTGGSLEVMVDYDISTGSGNGSSSAFSWRVKTVVDRIYGGCYQSTPPTSLSSTNNSIGSVDDLRPDIRFTTEVKAADNAGIYGFVSPQKFCNPSQDIKVRVKNSGTNLINFLSINWSINGAPQPTYYYNHPLDTFGGAGINDTVLSIGSHFFSPNTAYNIKVWTSMPNNTADTTNMDDTVTVVRRMSMSGNYAVGGTSPDFASLSDISNALNEYGTCGTVKFEFANGAYTGQLKLSDLDPGNDSIVFTSAGNDSTLVTISYPASAAAGDNFLARIDNSRNIIFRNLTFERSGTGAYSTIFQLSKTSAISFIANHFKAPVSTAANSDGSRSGIFSDDTQTEDSTLIIDNKFSNNSNAIWYYSSPSRPSVGTVIHHNIMENSYVNVFLKHHEGVRVTNNLMSRGLGNGAHDYYGISAENCDGSIVFARNKITYDRGYGIKVFGCDGTAANRGRIYNNMISGTQTAATLTYGFSIESTATYNCAYLDFYHNTVLINNTSATTGRVLNFTGVAASFNDHIRIRNNIFSNLGAGYVYYIPANAIGNNIEFNRNNLYAAGVSLGTWKNTTSLPNNDGLRNWIMTTGQDSLSSNHNVIFTSSSDLSISGTSVGDFNLATDIPALTTTDINGNTRSLSLPYKGAYEATAIAPSSKGDAAMWMIINPVAPLTAQGNQDIKVMLRNSGLSAITYADIYYSLNGGPAVSYAFAGNLQPGENTILTISNTNINAGPNQFSVWVQNTNMTGDLNSLNDTLKLSFTGAPSLIGNYTVGATGADYTSLTAVSNALRNNAVAGDVTFELISTYASSSETLPIRFSAPVNPIGYAVTIRPAAGTTNLVTEGDPGSSNSLINLDSTSGITFDGRAGGTGNPVWILRNTRTATTFAAVIRLINGAQNNIFRYLQIEGQGTTTTTGLFHISTSTQSFGNRNNKLEHNIIRDRSDVTGLPYSGIYCAGTAASPNENNTFDNNHFINFTNNGISVTGTGNGNGWKITNNHFYRTVTATAANNILNFIPGSGSSGNTIANNYFGGSAPFTASSAYSFNAGTAAFAVVTITADTTVVSGNVIKNIYVNGTSGVTTLIDISSSSRNIVITNNALGDSLGIDTTGTAKGSAMNGILSASTGNIEIRNNVISNLYNYSTGTSAAMRAIDHSGTGSSLTVVQNRVFNIRSNTNNTTFLTSGQFAVNGILSRTTAQLRISENLVHDIQALGTPTTTITCAAIISSGSASADISRNTVYNVRNTSLSTGNDVRVFGIGIFDAPGEQRIYNNFISLGETTQATIFGILHNGSAAQPGPIKVYYNSVYIGETASAGTKTSYAFYRLFKTPCELKNNIFYNTRSGGGTVHAAIGNLVDTPTVGWVSDYNTLYSPDTAVRLATINNPAVPLSYSQWQTVSGGDQHSVCKTVNFVSPAIADLHLTGSSVGDLTLQGIALPGYTTDFDNDARHIYPYMGADEITASPLPVKLNSFTAAKKETNVLLFWTTSTEKNASYYVVEASSDGKNFKAIGKVQAKGNSSSLSSYTFSHANAQEAMNGAQNIYYRLTITDRNSSSERSGIVMVNFDDNKQVLDAASVYPNPFTHDVTLSIPSFSAEKANISVFDMQGRNILTQEKQLDEGVNQLVIDELNSVNQGVYFIKVNLNNESKTIKIVKQ